MGMESNLCGVYQSNMDLVVFQETNLPKLIYMHESSGYKVVATEAPSAHSNGVAVFYRAAEQFYVEALQTYRADVASFQLVSDDRWWCIMECYLSPDDALTIE